MAAGGGYLALDEEDPEAEPLRLTREDVARWQLDILAVCERLHGANALVGTAARLDNRLWMIGDLPDATSGVVLGLLDSTPLMLPLVRSLPSLVSSQYSSLILICPSFVPTPLERRSFESLSIFFGALDDSDVFRLRLPDQLGGSSAPTRRRLAKRRTGRPRGHGFGALLDCWLYCHELEDLVGSATDAYNLVAAYFAHHPMTSPAVPLRERFPNVRSDAARRRIAVERCESVWHGKPLPHDLIHD